MRNRFEPLLQWAGSDYLVNFLEGARAEQNKPFTHLFQIEHPLCSMGSPKIEHAQRSHKEVTLETGNGTWHDKNEDASARSPGRHLASNYLLRMLASLQVHRIVRDIIFVWVLMFGIVITSHSSRQFQDAQHTHTATSTTFLAPRPTVAKVAFDATKLSSLNHLVVVAGHAVAVAESLDSADWQDDVWYLMDYQRNQDLPKVLVSHIEHGVHVAAQDNQALLVFSGGQTRSGAGPRDEGSSYYRVAEHYSWWGHAATGLGESELLINQRTVTEDFATDSFQNLIFSICRFHEVVGSYPERITVVGFEFKRQRFENLHRAAIRFPRSQFRYFGVQPARGSRFDFAKAELGERRNSLRQFQVDPYGCHNPELAAKRDARNPFRRTNPYPLACPELRDLLAWCGVQIFSGPLPWSKTGKEQL